MTEDLLGTIKPSTDDPIAQRLIDFGFADRARYDHGRGRWIIWNGVRWHADGTRRVYDLLREDIVALVMACTDNEDAKALMQVFNTGKKESVLKALSARPEIAMKGDEWDRDPYLLGFDNGIVDLRTGEFDAHPSHDMMVSKSVGCDYDPKARCPHFTKFLQDIMGGDDELVQYLGHLLGYSLFGLQSEQKFWMWVGRGANGKGILARTMLRTLGEYAERPSDELYMRNKFGAAPSSAARPDLVRLMGARFIYVSEPQGGQFNEELLKAHTGDDPILARDLYGRAGDMLVFPPTHKIIVLTNDMPKTDDVGVSMRRRVRVIRFEQDYSPESGRADNRLEGRIEKEKAGIMNLLIALAGSWHENGLPDSPKVEEWSREYIEENDPLSRWEHDACRVGRGERGQSALLYASYQDWCAKNAVEARSQMWLSGQLGKRYHKEKGSNGSMYFNGIAPKGAMEAAEDDDE